MKIALESADLLADLFEVEGIVGKAILDRHAAFKDQMKEFAVIAEVFRLEKTLAEGFGLEMTERKGATVVFHVKDQVLLFIPRRDREPAALSFALDHALFGAFEAMFGGDPQELREDLFDRIGVRAIHLAAIVVELRIKEAGKAARELFAEAFEAGEAFLQEDFGKRADALGDAAREGFEVVEEGRKARESGGSGKTGGSGRRSR